MELRGDALPHSAWGRHSAALLSQRMARRIGRRWRSEGALGGVWAGKAAAGGRAGAELRRTGVGGHTGERALREGGGCAGRTGAVRCRSGRGNRDAGWPD